MTTMMWGRRERGGGRGYFPKIIHFIVTIYQKLSPAEGYTALRIDLKGEKRFSAVQSKGDHQVYSLTFYISLSEVLYQAH